MGARGGGRAEGRGAGSGAPPQPDVQPVRCVPPGIHRAHGDTFATNIYMPHENGSAPMDLFVKHTMSNTYAVDLV